MISKNNNKKLYEQMKLAEIYKNMNIEYYDKDYDEMVPINIYTAIRAICLFLPYNTINILRKDKRLKKYFRNTKR